jgi:hypothetical protein
MAFLYFPNGIPKETWYPRKTGRGGELLELSEWMSPLEPFKRDMIIPSNVWTPEGNGHGEGTATWLTGRGYERGEVGEGGASIDQVAAKAIGDETLLPSLELSLQGEGYFSNSLPRNSISWTEHHTPVAREVEPRAVFDRMFRPGSGGATNRSVLDMVLAEARSLRGKVSRADDRRVDEYLESIRALEKRIEFAEKQSDGIREDKAFTDTLTAPRPGIPADHTEYVRLMLDMMVVAFWSDATRVCTFMLDHGQSNRYFNFIDDVRGTWHALSHYRDASGKTEDDDGKTSWSSVKEKRSMYAEVTRWHHAQVAYLLGRMKSIREPNGGTLLDNSMILYGSSLGDGDAHSERHLPTILAGGGAGTLDTGRFIESKKRTNLADIQLAMLQRMGVTAETFGTSDGPMEALGRRSRREWF